MSAASFGPGHDVSAGPISEHGDAPASGPAGDPVKGGLAGLPKSSAEYFALGPARQNGSWPTRTRLAYVALKMLKEAGVTLMLSAYVATRSCKATESCGVFVENKSGRQAVKAKGGHRRHRRGGRGPTGRHSHSAAQG